MYSMKFYEYQLHRKYQFRLSWLVCIGGTWCGHMPQVAQVIITSGPHPGRMDHLHGPDLFLRMWPNGLTSFCDIEKCFDNVTAIKLFDIYDSSGVGRGDWLCWCWCHMIPGVWCQVSPAHHTLLALPYQM